MIHSRLAFVLIPLLVSAGLGACYGQQTSQPDAGDGTNQDDAGGGAPTPGSTDATVAPTPDAPLTAPQRGEKLVQKLGCAGCHQSPDPNGPLLAGNESVRKKGVCPPNITPDKDTGIGDWTEEQIVRAIREGKDDQMEDLCSSMPRYADLSYAQASDIVAFLRGLPPIKHQVPDGQCDDDDGDGGDGDDGGDDADTDDDSGSDDASSDASNDAAPDAPRTDAGFCTDFAPPTTPASCHACGAGACQANGCFGGFYCELASGKCHVKPDGCP